MKFVAYKTSEDGLFKQTYIYILKVTDKDDFEIFLDSYQEQKRKSKQHTFRQDKTCKIYDKMYPENSIRRKEVPNYEWVEKTIREKLFNYITDKLRIKRDESREIS